MKYSNKPQKKRLYYEHSNGRITEYDSYLWRVLGYGNEFFDPIIPEYSFGKFEFFVGKTRLIYKLVFMTIFKYGRKKPLSKQLLIRGVGQPRNLSQLAGILGSWEAIGFLKKIGKGKEALYYFEPAVYDFSWQGETPRQTNDFQYVLSYTNITENYVNKTHQRALK